MPHECTTCGRQFDDGSKEMLSGCPNCGGNKFQFQPPGRSAEPEEPAGATDPDDSVTVADASTDSASTADTAPSTPEPTDTASTTESADPLSDPGAQGDLDLPDDTAHAAEAAGDDSGGTVDADTPNAADPDTTPTESAEERYRDAEIDEFRDAEIADDTDGENSAQRDARSAAVSPEEIEDARKQVADTEPEAAPDDGSRGRGTPQGPPAETPARADPDEFDLSDAVGDDDPVEKQPVAGSAPEREEPVAEEDADLSALREELNQQFESIKITAPGQYELNLMELYDRKEYIISLQEDGRYVIEMADDYGIDED
ncbi:MAG: OapC/ArvC family zinc-ribbon domain-containing protein [Halolamina sp.]